MASKMLLTSEELEEMGTFMLYCLVLVSKTRPFEPFESPECLFVC